MGEWLLLRATCQLSNSFSRVLLPRLNSGMQLAGSRMHQASPVYQHFQTKVPVLVCHMHISCGPHARWPTSTECWGLSKMLLMLKCLLICPLHQHPDLRPWDPSSHFILQLQGLLPPSLHVILSRVEEGGALKDRICAPRGRCQTAVLNNPEDASHRTLKPWHSGLGFPSHGDCKT